MSASGGNNNSDDPHDDRDDRDTVPLDPLDILDGDAVDIDAGWDLEPDELLAPDEGPTVVDGSLEMAAAEAVEEESREPSRTFLGMGPSNQVEPDEHDEDQEDEEPTTVSATALPEPPAPEPPAPEPPAPEPTAPEPKSPLASLAAQDVAFKDTLPGDLSQMAPEAAPVQPALEPEPVLDVQKEAEAPSLTRPLQPTTKPALSRPLVPPAKKRPPAETEPSEPVRLPRTPTGKDSEIAHAVTIAPDSEESMAHAPTLAPDPDSELLRPPPLVKAPAPLPAAEPEPAPPAPPAPAPPAAEPAPLEGPTQTVEPISRQPRPASRAPSNLTLTVLWVLALISVVVAVALFLLRPSI